MAVTARQLIDIKPKSQPIALPVASGETIFEGTLVAIGNDGLLYNLDAASILIARMVGVVADDTINPAKFGGETATTSAGSISGSREEASDDAGDKTVRLVYVDGRIKLTFTAIAQTDVGKVVYATDNFTVDESQSGGVAIGTLDTFISATTGWVNLNNYFNVSVNGITTHKQALIAATTTTGGDVISWQNPTAENIILIDVITDITTAASGVATMDVGVAANGTTTSDTIYDLLDIGSAAILASASSGDGGTNGQLVRGMSSTQFVTGTPSATAAGLVGTVTFIYMIQE